MPLPTVAERLAICSWSLQPADAGDLMSKVRATGLTRIQLALDPLLHSPASWSNAGQLFQEAGIQIVSGMFGCIGEDYSTLESIRRTGGIAPDATWEENLRNIRSAAKLSSQLGLKLVTFHAGFLPHSESDPAFATMLKRLAVVAGICAEANIRLGLETGQEEANELVTLLQKLDRPNVGVNFDPANMILYNKGDPIEALELLSPWLCQVHIKDAQRTKVPGTWGKEVVVGAGEVNWPDFFATLGRLNFTGNFVIEREAGAQRIADVRTAKELVLGLA